MRLLALAIAAGVIGWEFFGMLADGLRVSLVANLFSPGSDTNGPAAPPLPME